MSRSGRGKGKKKTQVEKKGKKKRGKFLTSGEKIINTKGTSFEDIQELITVQDEMTKESILVVKFSGKVEKEIARKFISLVAEIHCKNFTNKKKGCTC